MTEARIGASGPEFEWVVERGKVAEFARACTDTDPAYFGPDAIAPPTFLMVAHRFWEPPGGRPGLEKPFNDRRVLHGSQAFTYARPLRAGETLVAQTTLVAYSTKEGRRGGHMRIAEWETEHRSRQQVVATTRATVIETSSPSGRPPPPSTTPGQPDRPEPGLVVEDVDKMMFVRYAGASGDFNPIHWDDAYARSAGYPSVFGVGMFTAGVLARYLGAWQGAGTVRSFGVRFTGLVWPGETLSCHGTQGRPYDRDGEVVADCELEVTGSAGDRKATGTATCVQTSAQA